MTKRLPRLCAIGGLVACGAIQLAGSTSPSPSTPAAVLERFLATEHVPLKQYRALRRFEARNEKFDSTAWMNVWTEADSRGFRYEIAAEGGSGYIRERVFRGTLQTEQRSWAANAPERAAVSRLNYTFSEGGLQSDGSVRVAVTPRHKDLLLVDGSITLQPDTAELVSIEGRLSKTPSFWTRNVHIVRHYDRIAGIRVPIALETTSQVLIAGRSTFTMRWEYESINGTPVGAPLPSAGSSRAPR